MSSQWCPGSFKEKHLYLSCTTTFNLFHECTSSRSGVRTANLESFRVRPWSGSKEDTYEAQRGMPLHDEQTERPMLDNVNDGVSVGQYKHESSNENSRKRTVREHNYLYTYLSTILYAVTLVIESIFQFRWLHDSHSSISFFWLESCFIALFFKIWRRKRMTRLVVQKKKSVRLLMWWWAGLKKKCCMNRLRFNKRYTAFSKNNITNCRNSQQSTCKLKCIYFFSSSMFRWLFAYCTLSNVGKAPYVIPQGL